MLYISIAVTMLALLGGMFLLDKTKKEGLGNFFKWVSYFIIVVSILLIICQFTQGIIRMACNHGICAPSERCMPGMMGRHHGKAGGMMHHGMMDGGGKCCDEMGEGMSKGMKKHGCGMEEEDEDDAAKADSAIH